MNLVQDRLDLVDYGGRSIRSLWSRWDPVSALGCWRARASSRAAAGQVARGGSLDDRGDEALEVVANFVEGEGATSDSCSGHRNRVSRAISYYHTVSSAAARLAITHQLGSQPACHPSNPLHPPHPE